MGPGIGVGKSKVSCYLRNKPLTSTCPGFKTLEGSKEAGGT